MNKKKKPLLLDEMGLLIEKWKKQKVLRDKIDNSNICEKCKYFNERDEKCSKGWEIEKVFLDVFGFKSENDFLFISKSKCEFHHYLD